MMKQLLRAVMLGASVIMLSSCSNHDSNNETQQLQTEETMSTPNYTNATPEQLAGITKAMDAYINAAIKGDSKIAEAVFTPNATMTWNENGKLVSVPIQALYDFFNNNCPQESSYEISVCNVAGNAAIVAIDSQVGETKFADMFSLVKDGDDWKIVSKIYQVK